MAHMREQSQSCSGYTGLTTHTWASIPTRYTEENYSDLALKKLSETWIPSVWLAFSAWGQQRIQITTLLYYLGNPNSLCDVTLGKSKLIISTLLEDTHLKSSTTNCLLKCQLFEFVFRLRDSFNVCSCHARPSRAPNNGPIAQHVSIS